MPMNLRPRFMQATPVVPLPMKGSRIESPPICNNSSINFIGDEWDANLDWLEASWQLCEEYMYIFCSYHFVADIRNELPAAKIAALLTWYKRNTPNAVANVPRFTSEFIWAFRKGVGTNKWNALHTTVFDYPNLTAGCISTGERVTNSDGTVAHPTQKPIKLIEELLQIGGDSKPFIYLYSI